MQIECTVLIYFCRSSLKHLPHDIDSWVLVSDFGLRQWSASFLSQWLGWTSSPHI